MMTFTINLIGILTIALILWWFVFKQPQSTNVKGDVIKINVDDGVYQPAVIRAKKSNELHLEFMRKDQSACSQVVVFETLGISQELPINKPKIVRLKNLSPGIYPFSCQMGMYQGKLIVE